MSTITTKPLSYDVEHLSVSEILKDDKFNCRGAFDSQSLETLANSIRDSGLQTPITVMPIDQPPYKYKIVCGHRRFAATKMIRAKTVPAYVRNMSEIDAAILNLVENIERKNLNIIEEANGLRSIFNQGLTTEEIAKKTQLGRKYVDIRLKLLLLPQKIQDLAAMGSIQISDLKTIIAAYDTGKNDDDLIKIAENAFHIRNAQKDLSKTALLSARAIEESRESLGPYVPKTPKLVDVESLLDTVNRAYGKVGIDDAPMTQTLRWFLLGISTYQLLSSLKQDLALLGETFIIPPQYELEHNANWKAPARTTSTNWSSDTGDDLSDSED